MSIFTLVAVPPRIEKFSFREGLGEGMRTRVICGVYQGAEPLSLEWLQDGRPLETAVLAGVTVKPIDRFSSVLMIGPLRADHSGRYTCRAQNAAATAESTADLVVNGEVLARIYVGIARVLT